MKCIKIYSILSNFENETTTIEAIAEYDEKENVINYTEEDLKVKIKIGKDKVLIDRKNEDYCLSLEFIPNEKVECKYEVKSIGLNLDIDVITKVLEIENYKDLTKVSYNYEDATINLVKKDDKWKDESDTSKSLDSNNINSEMLSTLVEIDASTKIDSPEDISQYGFTKDSDGNITGETNSITVTDNDGKVNKIYIGSTNPYDSTKYYMMVNDDTNVYVVDSTVNDAFSKDVEELEEETTTVEETTEETTTVSETTAQETTAE